MPKMDWKICIDNQSYEIELNHNLLLGSRNIRVNGDLVERCSPNLEYKGSVHRFMLGQHSGQILISSAIFRFYYQLFIDGRPAEYEDDWWFSGEQKQAAFYQTEQLAWETVGKKVGLTYLPNLSYFPDGIAHHCFPIHRLVGKFQGYFIKVAPAEYLNDRAITFIILFRHGSIEDTSKLLKFLRDDPEITKRLSRFRMKNDEIIVDKDVTCLYIPFNPGERLVEVLFDHIVYLTKVIRQYANPLPDTCEGKNLNHADISTIRWVLINNFPFLYCQECINQVPELAKKNREAIEFTPSGVSKSVIFELIVFVVLLALYILLIPLNQIFLILAICLFVLLIPMVIEKNSRKITNIDMLIGYGFATFFNSLVLIYFLIHRFLRGAGANWSGNLLQVGLNLFIHNLLIILLFSAIPAFVIPLILSYKRWQQKENLRPYLHPTLEILPSNINRIN